MERGAGRRDPAGSWVHLVKSLIREWGARVEGYDAPPGGPIEVYLVLPSEFRRAPGGGGWARYGTSAVSVGWSIQCSPEPGSRFSISTGGSRWPAELSG